MDDWVKERLAEFPGGPGDRAEQLPEEEVEPLRLPSVDAYRVVGDVPALPRGLVVTQRGIVPAVPPIRRVYHLHNAARKYYYNPFYVEERAPGAQVRLVRIDGELVGFTEDGRWCPFASDRAGELVDEEIFDRRPELVVCACIDGTATPYELARSGADGDGPTFELRVFDMMERDQPWPLAPDSTYELVADHGLPGVARRGPFESDDLGEMDAWLSELAEGGAPGAVAKPIHRQHRPLVCGTVALMTRSLPAWRWLVDDGVDRIAARQLRALLSSVELAPEAEPDWEGVGRSLLRPLLEAARVVAAGGELSRPFAALFRNRERAEAQVALLADEAPDVEVEVRGIEEIDGGWRLRFVRRYAAATSYLEERLSGRSFLE